MSTPQSRLLKLADEAVADYNATHAAGGEAAYPSWVEDVRLLCNATIPAGWLPIESAPKDGQSILGRGPRQDTVVIAWDDWAQPEARWKAVHLDVNGYECPEIVLRGEPTLWQPMPAPPCPTCNDQGAVGNILTAQPCPACAAPGVSTVEAQPAAWMEPGIDVPVTNEYRNKTPLRQAKYCVPLYKHAPVNAPAAGDAQTAAARDVLAERQRQISAEGWTAEKDDTYAGRELADAAAQYVLLAGGWTHLDIWPWARSWLKPTTPRRNLVKAGALILAEIERLDRAAQRKGDA